MKPVIIYVDDQPENLLLLKGACPLDWDLYLFEDPVEAIRKVQELNPWVIISDQRMPQMLGYQFLEICRGISPASVRIIVTGYSDENSLIQSVRKAHIADFLQKPWEESELIARVSAAIKQYSAARESARLESALVLAKKEIKDLKLINTALSREVDEIKEREGRIRNELVSWVPSFVVESIEKGIPVDKINRSISLITFDIKKSARLFEISHDGQPIRNRIIQIFTESVTRHFGTVESRSGDSAYGHFGLLHDSHAPADSALSAALDFRMALKNLERLTGLAPNVISAGVALHFTTELPVHIHSTHFYDSNGEILVQKGFDTSSTSVDIVHRIEKISHPILGTNIVLTKDFLESLKTSPPDLLPLGSYEFTGHRNAIDLYILPDGSISEDDLKKIRPYSK